ncbi:MAG: ATPase [Caulobacteraceae bacterium]|nr:ATPase [Caulobacteraceae bacterium]
MADPLKNLPARRERATLVLLIACAIGAGAPIALASLGQARMGPALIGAATVATVGLILLFVQARSAGSAPPAPGPAEQETGAGAGQPFAAVLEHLTDPILLVAAGERRDLSARRFIFANVAARELLRIQRADGPLTTVIRAPEVLAAVDEALFEATAGHALYQSGGVQDRVWRARALPLTSAGDDQGTDRLALLTLRDETEIRRSERTRADFLANASHELRTPLASLAGFIETLRGHARDDAQAREKFLAIMQIQAERMRRLIDDLMSLSRIELGEHIPPSDRVDLGLATADVLDALDPLAAERGVSFNPTLPVMGEAMVVGDRDQILQVIQNLAENALKFTPRGGTVEVEIVAGVGAAAAAAPLSISAAHLSLLTPDHAAGGRYAALRVRDAGPGIARTRLPRLTERFYRVEGQKSGEHSGTGLGLAIVKHIINRHRGGLTVESAEGQGSTFTAYVPMAEEAKTPSVAPPAPVLG